MALYHKYRPENWKQIQGNEKLIENLQNLITRDKENIPHAFLFTGETGCGKTTIARILAKELDCNGNDLREVNSADFRGIDTIREMIKQSSYAALEGSSRMWIIDECHKLTNDAQNALLKILEDTPPHVYFALATTDPQKLLAAVKNRCTEYKVELLCDKDMYRLLRKITTKEGETLEREVYDQIIQDAQGHSRQAIQVLDQVLSSPPENRLAIAEQKASELNESIALCRSLIAGDSWRKVSGILKGLKGQDVETIRRAVAGYATSVLLNGENDQAALILEIFCENFYDTGWAELVFGCYSVIKS